MRTNRRYADLGEHQNLLGLAGLHDRDEDVLIAQIESVYNTDRQRVETLTITEYVDFLSDVPLPSAQQRNEFAEFVSTAHSWYKHLPTNLPGQPFYFFIDKYAGCDRLLRKDGTAVLAERTERGFHYSDLPTKEYRSRFGYLAFSCSAGTVAFVADWPPVYSRDKVAAVPRDDGAYRKKFRRQVRRTSRQSCIRAVGVIRSAIH